MSDTAIGFLIVGIGLLVVLGLVFAVAVRGGTAARSAPPPGVHLPPPSLLPIVVSVAAALLGAGLAFRGEDQLANPFLAGAGLVVLVAGIVAWVRAANHEWRETEHGAHDDGAAH